MLRSRRLKVIIGVFWFRDKSQGRASGPGVRRRWLQLVPSGSRPVSSDPGEGPVSAGPGSVLERPSLLLGRPWRPRAAGPDPGSVWTPPVCEGKAGRAQSGRVGARVTRVFVPVSTAARPPARAGRGPAAEPLWPVLTPEPAVARDPSGGEDGLRVALPAPASHWTPGVLDGVRAPRRREPVCSLSQSYRCVPARDG